MARLGSDQTLSRLYTWQHSETSNTAKSKQLSVFLQIVLYFFLLFAAHILYTGAVVGPRSLYHWSKASHNKVSFTFLLKYLRYFLLWRTAASFRQISSVFLPFLLSITMVIPLLPCRPLLHPPPHLHLHLHPTPFAFSSSFSSFHLPPYTSVFSQGRWSCAWTSPQSPLCSWSSCQWVLLPPASCGSSLFQGGVSHPRR